MKALVISFRGDDAGGAGDDLKIAADALFHTNEDLETGVKEFRIDRSSYDGRRAFEDRLGFKLWGIRTDFVSEVKASGGDRADLALKQADGSCNLGNRRVHFALFIELGKDGDKLALAKIIQSVDKSLQRVEELLGNRSAHGYMFHFADAGFRTNEDCTSQAGNATFLVDTSEATYRVSKLCGLG